MRHTQPLSDCDDCDELLGREDADTLHDADALDQLFADETDLPGDPECPGCTTEMELTLDGDLLWCPACGFVVDVGEVDEIGLRPVGFDADTELDFEAENRVLAGRDTEDARGWYGDDA